MRPTSRELAGAFVLASVVSVLAQAPASNPRFEVASVKQNTSSGLASGISMRAGRVTISNYTFLKLLSNAYGIEEFEIVGGPGWIKTDRFDVNAKAPEGSTPSRQELFSMWQSLLIERFNLQVRREAKSGPVYALVVARSDGRPGEHLRRSLVDCITPGTEVSRDREKCGQRYEHGVLHFRGMPLASLIEFVKPMVQRPIIDRTGLSGGFDFDLEYDLGADSTGPSIFTAFEEQLGLKLESAQGPVAVLVIDHVEHPTPD
jgi:uncharacterized protein (TIGR03435 family)